MKPTRVRKLVKLDLSLLKQINAYRSSNFIATENEALRRLIIAGLKIENTVKESVPCK